MLFRLTPNHSIILEYINFCKQYTYASVLYVFLYDRHFQFDLNTLQGTRTHWRQEADIEKGQPDC